MYLPNIYFTELYVLKVRSSLEYNNIKHVNQMECHKLQCIKHCAKEMNPPLVTLLNVSMEISQRYTYS